MYKVLLVTDPLKSRDIKNTVSEVAVEERIKKGYNPEMFSQTVQGFK